MPVIIRLTWTSDQEQRSQHAQRKKNQQQKVLRQRQAEEKKNDFDDFEEYPNEVVSDDKDCESEDPTDDEPSSPDPVSNTKPNFNIHF